MGAVENPFDWKPRTQYLAAVPERGRDDGSVQACTTVKEACSLVAYWNQLRPDREGAYRVVKAVTTYELVEVEAPAVQQVAEVSAR